MPPLLKRAIICGAAPLAVGTLIYATWRVTRWDWLTIAGMFAIAVGLVAFLGGSLCLERHLRTAADNQPIPRRSLRIQGLLVGTLLLINFPAAAFFILSAVGVETRYTVTVLNESATPIESFVVTGPGVRAELGPVRPGKRGRKHLHFSGDGALDFAARQQEVTFSGQLDGYVSNGMGGAVIVNVKSGRVYEVRVRHGQTMIAKY